MNTCISYKRDLYQMEDFLCRGNGDVVQYACSIKESKSTSTVNRIYSAMKGFFAYLQEQGLIEENPMKGIRAPRAEKNPRKVFTDEEKMILKNLPKGFGDKAVRDRAMMAVMFDTGFKVSKLMDLRLDDVKDLKLSLETQVILDDYIYGTRPSMVGDNACEHLFTNYEGRPMSRQGFWKIMRQYTEDGRI